MALRGGAQLWCEKTERGEANGRTQRALVAYSPPPSFLPGSFVTHETKCFIYFYLGQTAVLLFKSG